MAQSKYVEKRFWNIICRIIDEENPAKELHTEKTQYMELADAIEDWTELVAYANAFTNAEIIEYKSWSDGTTSSVCLCEKVLD